MKTAPSESASLASARARIADIRAQLLQLQETFEILQEEQASLQDELDDYTYPVLTLPNEIISEIFVHFLPVYPARPRKTGLLSPILLCQICRAWREIALSTPALWRAVGVSISNFVGPEKSNRELRWLETSLTRSGSCPLSIKLVPGLIDTQALAPFIKAIAPHCARWEHLKLWPGSRSELYAIEGPLSSLRSLTIGGLGQSDDLALLHTAPLLRKVAVQFYDDWYLAIVPWSQLTVLTVHGIKAAQCGPILHLSPRLIHCRLVLHEAEEQLPMSAGSITLPLLETLVLAVDRWDGHGVPGIFGFLTLSALRKLQISTEFLSRGPVPSLRGLISRSSCRLQRVHFIDSDGRGDVCKPCRKEWPTVRFTCGAQLEPRTFFFRKKDYVLSRYRDVDYDSDEEEAVWKEPKIWDDSDSDSSES
ncbi:hypothetical protein DFH06DRAFT_640828 [Mycena polygramma]|nr:hypothetical protein DFH06DRAFT_640828 [Mycena polygramma]